MRISDWSSDVCSSDLQLLDGGCAALAASAMNDHRFIAGDLIRFKQNVAQGNQFSVQIGFFEFEIFADINQLEVFVIVDLLLQFFYRYFFYDKLISLLAKIKIKYVQFHGSTDRKNIVKVRSN